MLRPRAVAALAGGACAAALVAVPQNRERLTVAAERTTRFVRCVKVFSLISWDYKHSLRTLKEGSEEYKAALQEVNQRSAVKFVELCRKHGGIFTKFGQHIASMNHVLPKEVVETVAVLQDRASPKPFNEVKRVVEADLGGPLRWFFREFDPEPLASASLAQVHHAVTADGQEVAVKVQYPLLRRQTLGDLFTIELLASLVPKFFPDFDFLWVVPEFRHNLSLEMDFRQEAANGARTAQWFAGRQDVHVPTVRHDLTSDRVLTMEFIRGIKVNDVTALRAHGLDPLRVAALVSGVFSDMIYCHGFVHCDPHPGNLMVRRLADQAQGSGARRDAPQLVLLDHGLYRQLDEQFRVTYCLLWKSLIIRDNEMLRKACEQLGVGKYYKIFPVIFTHRAHNSRSARLGGSMSKQELEKLRTDVQEVKFQQVNEFMQSLPRDMLFVMRTDNLVRSINKDLGGTSRQRFKIMMSAAVRGLSMEDEHAMLSAPAPAAPASLRAAAPATAVPAPPLRPLRKPRLSVWQWLRYQTESVFVQWQLWVIDTLMWYWWSMSEEGRAAEMTPARPSG